jgi:hypothetical protein
MGCCGAGGGALGSIDDEVDGVGRHWASKVRHSVVANFEWALSLSPPMTSSSEALNGKDCESSVTSRPFTVAIEGGVNDGVGGLHSQSTNKEVKWYLPEAV